MWIARFDPGSRIAWVRARLLGPLGEREVKCILDTGTPVTIIDPGISDSLGYSARMAKGRSRLWSVGGPQDGYLLDVLRFDAMGLKLQHCEVACHDLQGELGVEGLFGMDLIEGRVLTIDAQRGRITLASTTHRRTRFRAPHQH